MDNAMLNRLCPMDTCRPVGQGLEGLMHVSMPLLLTLKLHGLGLVRGKHPCACQAMPPNPAA